MSIIVWVILGLVAGAIAKALMPGKDPGGIVVTMLIGIVGAVVGGFLWNLLTGNDSYGDFDMGDLLIAILGPSCCSPTHARPRRPPRRGGAGDVLPLRTIQPIAHGGRALPRTQRVERWGARIEL